MVTPFAVFLNVGLVNEMAPEIVNASDDVVEDAATVLPSIIVFCSLVADAEYRLWRFTPVLLLSLSVRPTNFWFWQSTFINPKTTYTFVLKIESNWN